MFTPVYHELVPRLKQYMEEQKSGKLPGVRSLAKQFGVNPATVSKAMKILEEKGLISILKGQGAFSSVGKYRRKSIIPSGSSI